MDGNLGKYREALKHKEADLTKVNRRDEITIERNADQLDEIQSMTERDLAVSTLNRESNMLRQVRAALKRIEQGEFGICQDCEEEISPKRLTAVPWAARCLQCQERADRESREGVSDTRLADAA